MVGLQGAHGRATSNIAAVENNGDDEFECGETLKGVFYNDELQLYVPVAHAVKGADRFVIERLVKPVLRTNDDKKVKMFEVKWSGYKEHTEEPRATLLIDVPHLVKRFERDRAVERHTDKQPTFSKK